MRHQLIVRRMNTHSASTVPPSVLPVKKHLAKVSHFQNNMKWLRIPMMFAWLLLFAVVTHTRAEAGLCLAQPLHDLAQKHAEIYKWIYDAQVAAQQRILTKKRWKDLDFPLGEAQVDLQASLARAHEVSSGSGGLGVDTAKAQAEVLTGDAVCDSAKTSLENAGAGIGYLVKDSGLPDTEVAAVVKHINNVTIPSKTIFNNMGITVAELTDSVRVLREAGVTIPADQWTEANIRQPANAGGGSGAAAELLIAAKDVRSGGNVSSFGIDLQDPQFAETKIDYMLDQDKMVQVGLSLETVVTKLTGGTNLEAMATAIVKAKFLEPNRNFVFKYLDASGAKPSQARIEALNAYITNSAFWLSADNFLPVTSIP
jgi:hypothetical protein